MWSVKTRPKASVSSAGGCFGLAVLVMAIWVKALSQALGDNTQYYAGRLLASWTIRSQRFSAFGWVIL